MVGLRIVRREEITEEVLEFIIGFAIWIVFGLVAGTIVKATYKAAGTEPVLTLVFAVLGSFVGGMLGSSAHVFHHDTPLRIGGLIGAASGAVLFSALYHFIARKVV